MNFRYAEKKVTLPDNVHAYAEKKVMKLQRYFRDDADALVTFSVEKIRKNKTRLAKRIRQDALVREPEAVSSFVPDEPEDPFQIVRIKRFNMKLMTREEAILQMNLLEHSFFAFRDEEADGAFAVVYKRNDGGYGLIEDAE